MPKNMRTSIYKRICTRMMTSSNGNIFRVTGPGEFPTQRPVTRSFDVFFDLRLNKMLSKQPWGWWFETQSWSLWRHCNGFFLCFLTQQIVCIFFGKYSIMLTKTTLLCLDTSLTPVPTNHRFYMSTSGAVGSRYSSRGCNRKRSQGVMDRWQREK